MSNPNKILCTSPTVLIVNDVPDRPGVIHETLEAAGYTVLIANDGITALRQLEKVVPDAILMDALMQGMPCFEACRIIKANPELRQIPIIFMTDLNETPDVVQGLAVGGTDYLVKPVRPVELLARLRTHIHAMQSLHFAEQALDANGSGLLVLDHALRTIWQSPRAKRLLFQAAVDVIHEPLPLHGVPLEAGQISHISNNGSLLCLRHLVLSSRQELILIISECGGHEHMDGLAKLALTPRETEVLSWLAKGKTNRDIGDILEMSPRTVSKHLEHVFQKLGVETRSAAAAMATSLHLDRSPLSSLESRKA